jgi:hypothetical protein
LEEATEKTADALKTLLEVMIEDKNVLPKPSNLAKVKKEVKIIRKLDQLPYPGGTTYQSVSFSQS